MCGLVIAKCDELEFADGLVDGEIQLECILGLC